MGLRAKTLTLYSKSKSCRKITPEASQFWQSSFKVYIQTHKNCYLNSLKKNFFNVYLFLRETQSVSGGEAERKGDTESEAGSRLRAVSTEPDAELELTNREIMTLAEVGCLTN